MEHYYTSEPSAPHDRRSVSLELDGKTYVFTTDAGVFSRDRIDYGSELLLRACPDPGGDLLDLGCGCGVLGLGLALRFPGTRPHLSDVNRRALELARENAGSLGLDAEVLESDGFSAWEGRRFSAVVTNPPIRAGKSVYYPWFAQSRDHLLPGGWFACVVRKGQGGPSVKKEMTAVFGRCDVISKSDGYWVLFARN